LTTEHSSPSTFDFLSISLSTPKSPSLIVNRVNSYSANIFNNFDKPQNPNVESVHHPSLSTTIAYRQPYTTSDTVDLNVSDLYPTTEYQKVHQAMENDDVIKDVDDNYNVVDDKSESLESLSSTHSDISFNQSEISLSLSSLSSSTDCIDADNNSNILTTEAKRKFRSDNHDKVIMPDYSNNSDYGS